MKKILISGYYGFDNAGDELILKTIINELNALSNELEITVLSASPEITRKQYIKQFPYLRCVSRNDLLTIIEEMLDTDLFVSGGGELIQDLTSFVSPYYYLFLIKLAQIFDKNTFICAQGFNSLHNNFTRYLTAAILNKITMISVRDEKSHDFLMKLGVKSSEVAITADPVWKIGKISEKTQKDIPSKIGFIFRFPKPGEVVDTGLWINVIEQIKQIWNSEILLIPFQKEKDMVVLNQFDKKINRIEWQTYDELLSVLSSVDLIISMRLHGLLIGLLNGSVTLGWGKDSKIEHFLECLGLNNDCFMSVFDTPEKVLNYIFSAWQNRSRLLKTRNEQVPLFINKSQHTYELILKLLDLNSNLSL